MEKYYYLSPDNKQQGPVSPDQFRMLGLTPSTYVWKEGMANWTHLSEVPGLLDWLKAEPASATASAPAPATYAQPQGSGFQSAAMPKPDSYLVLAILSTVLCCLPTGIYAIICSTRVDTFWASGHYEEAKKNSKQALIWSLIGAGAVVVSTILYFFLFLMAGIGSVL